jgi:hypothetical protein
VADADDIPGASTQAAGQAEGWETDRQKFEHTQLERVQASARVWLGVLTTLLGLLGSVVLFKGGDLVTGVTASGLFQVILLVLVSTVFVVTVLAVIFGGQATWGGLAYAAAPAARPAAPRPRWLRAWFSFARAIGLWSQPKTFSRGAAAEPRWKIYRDWSQASAERRRVYLHASRFAGVIAAGLIALLAIMAIIAGTVSPAATDVVVVHHGRVSCGPVNQSGTLTGVTQVMTVSNC